MSKCPSKACICSALTVWIFISVCSIIVSSVMYLKPFFRVIRFRETTCEVENTFYTEQYVCPCDEAGGGHACPAAYPCFLVQVSLNFTDGQLWVVTLYVDDDQQEAVLDASDERREKCTLRACVGSKKDNRETVENFSQQYGIRRKIVPCYFDPFDIRAGAVLKATIPGWSVFHSIFWPALSLTLGLAVCGIFCHWCRQNTATCPGETEEKSLNRDAAAAAAPGEAVASMQDGNNYAAAGRALVAQKKRKQRSLRNLWMLQQNV